MARFRFRLEVVLEHKQRLEDQAQLELAKAQALQVREEQRLQELLDSETAAFAELERQRFMGRLDIEALQMGMTYLDVLKTQILRQSQVVERVRRNTDAKREQLVGFMQERKALEQLRDRQKKDFIREENRREAIESDDMVVMRYARDMAIAKRNGRPKDRADAGDSTGNLAAGGPPVVPPAPQLAAVVTQETMNA